MPVWSRKRAEQPRVGSPVIPEPPGRAVIGGARFALFFTGAAWAAYVVEQLVRLSQSDVTLRTTAETIVYLTLVTLLTASASAYLLARVGYFERIKKHRRVPRSAIDDHFDGCYPPMTVIIPSYREDERVMRQTLLSAALQEYPDLRVVLLVDDPPYPSDPAQRQALEKARVLPGAIGALLAPPRRMFEAALAEFEADASPAMAADRACLDRLAACYDDAAAWFEAMMEELPRTENSDQFLAIEFFQRMKTDFETTARAVEAAGQEPGNTISRRRVHQLYARLAYTFQAELVSFERKQFASLSHEANKAMNLNSYIGLMGGEYCIVSSPGGRVLVPAAERTPDLVIPNADYVLTLDADSILLPEYCLRLVHFMEQAENGGVAVVQTPYSAYRNAQSRVERIAAATTDIQHIVHQGLTRYSATFWVGANAIIRKRALDELVHEEDHDGFTIRHYIKDRTVIEDTESSIDLRSRGWRLHNFPERLSYSATPPDFGALVIQRQRWANGGLVILPALLRQLRKRRAGVDRPGPAELFLRTNYLASISWSSLGLLLLLFYPFDGELLTVFGVVTALPYFFAMSNDLHRAGYRRWDIFGVYGFNLLLLPVNLAGTVQSIVQGIGGQKIAFARTPKVRNRTVAPLMFIVIPLLLVAWSGWTLLRDLDEQAYVHGAFAGVNMLLAAYACLAFIGARNVVIDLVVDLRDFVVRPVQTPQASPEVPHWASVLYVGSSLPEEVERNAPLAVALAAQDRFANGIVVPANPEAMAVERRVTRRRPRQQVAHEAMAATAETKSWN